MKNLADEDFWIFEENMVATLLILSSIAGHDFDISDLDVVKYGLLGTSSWDDKWFSYEFPGDKAILIEIANDGENDGLIFFRLRFNETLRKQIELCAYVVQEFDMKSRYFK